MKKAVLNLAGAAALALCLSGCAKDKATTDQCSGEAACADKSAATCSKATECCKAKAAGAATTTTPAE